LQQTKKQRGKNMEEKKWVEDLSTVKVNVIRFCPKCSKQSYHVSLNRRGGVLSTKCILCGYKG
jgi:hypothetical protein